MVQKFGNIMGYHITKYERPQFTFDFSNSTLVSKYQATVSPCLGPDRLEVINFDITE